MAPGRWGWYIIEQENVIQSIISSMICRCVMLVRIFTSEDVMEIIFNADICHKVWVKTESFVEVAKDAQVILGCEFECSNVRL